MGFPLPGNRRLPGTALAVAVALGADHEEHPAELTAVLLGFLSRP